jgi:predicted nucleic acid-binding protein
LFRSAGGIAAERIPITWLHRFEFANAVEIHVFLGQQGGHVRVTPEQAALAHALFADDLRTAQVCAIADISPDDLTPEVETLAARHTARHGFRTYDLMHVASALLLGCDTFWSFDAKAAHLAQLEGLKLR